MKKKAFALNDSAMSRLNRIKPGTNVTFNVLFLILSLMCFLPIIYVFMISISSEESIAEFGYKFIPEGFSAKSYKFLWMRRGEILNALWVSFKVTAIGTAMGVALTTLMGYVLSRREHKLNGFFTIVVFIPMIFGGGMAASYVVNMNILHLGNTIWALILPLCVSSFNVTIARTFFRTTIPDSIIESAKIDGASQWTIFGRIVLPISKPVLATIGLFLAFAYWNDWYQSSLYISERGLLSLQALLNSINNDIEFLTKNPGIGMTMADLRAAMPTEGFRMAIAVIVAVPIACVYPFFQKYFISGLTVGAVKG